MKMRTAGLECAHLDSNLVIWEYGNMKTTLDIPTDIYRQAKVKAAMEGRKLKDLIAEGLSAVLREG
jgi:hypothetical protein